MSLRDPNSARDKLARFNASSQMNQSRAMMRLLILGVILLLAIAGLFYLDGGEEDSAWQRLPQAACRAVREGDQSHLRSFLTDDFSWSFNGREMGDADGLQNLLKPWLREATPFAGDNLQTQREGEFWIVTFICGVAHGELADPLIRPLVRPFLVDLTLEETETGWRARRAVVRPSFVR